MPEETTGGRFERAVDLSLSPAAAVTATATGTGVELGDKGVVRLTLTTSAVGGTNPTLDVAVQTSQDNGVSDSWRTVASFAQKTSNTSERKCFAGIDQYVRLNFTVGGTGSPTFTVSCVGDAV